MGEWVRLGDAPSSRDAGYRRVFRHIDTTFRRNLTAGYILKMRGDAARRSYAPEKAASFPAPEAPRDLAL